VGQAVLAVLGVLGVAVVVGVLVPAEVLVKFLLMGSELPGKVMRQVAYWTGLMPTKLIISKLFVAPLVSLMFEELVR
jgi:hypothetical protein